MNEKILKNLRDAVLDHIKFTLENSTDMDYLYIKSKEESFEWLFRDILDEQAIRQFHSFIETRMKLAEKTLEASNNSFKLREESINAKIQKLVEEKVNSDDSINPEIKKDIIEITIDRILRDEQLKDDIANMYLNKTEVLVEVAKDELMPKKQQLPKNTEENRAILANYIGRSLEDSLRKFSENQCSHNAEEIKKETEQLIREAMAMAIEEMKGE